MIGCTNIYYATNLQRGEHNRPGNPLKTQCDTAVSGPFNPGTPAVDYLGCILVKLAGPGGAESGDLGKYTHRITAQLPSQFYRLFELVPATSDLQFIGN